MRDWLSGIGYNDWILPALLIVPLVGALVLWVHGAMLAASEDDEVGSGRAAAARMIALVTLGMEFVISLGLWWSFDPSNLDWQCRVDLPWIQSWGIRFTVGVDGIAVMMILLTTFIMFLSVLGSWTSIRRKTHSYYALALVL